MIATTLTEQIEMLRVQIEMALPLPLVLVLSSAREDDGTSAVAEGLARSMEAAGYSTLYVLANGRPEQVDGALEPKTLDDVFEFGISPYLLRGPRANGLRCMVLPDERIRHTVSRPSVSRFTELCRSGSQVTIVHVGSILTSSFAMLAAVTANGVLLTIREGRRVCTADRRLAEVLSREDARFLGIVSVSESVIRDTDPAESLWKSVRRPTAPTVRSDKAPSREEQAV